MMDQQTLSPPPSHWSKTTYQTLIQGHSVGYILGLEEEKHGHRILITCNRDMSTSLTDFPKSSNTRIQVKFLLVEKHFALLH